MQEPCQFDSQACRGDAPTTLRTGVGRFGRWALVLLAIVLLAAVELRFYQLERKSLWSDELYTAVNALYRDVSLGQQVERFRRTTMNGVIDSDTFWTVKASDQSPPLFDLIAKGSVKLFEPIERGVRLPSVVFSVVLLLFLAWSAARAREAVQARVFLVVMILTAFSATAIEYAQEGRPYSLGLLIAGILSAHFYTRLQQGLMIAPLPRWPEIVAFIVGCYTHYNLIVFSAPLLALYGAIALARRDRRSLLALALVPLAFLPWAYLAKHAILYTATGGVAWYPEVTRLQAVVDSLEVQSTVLGKGFSWLAIVLLVSLLGLWLFGRRNAAAGAVRTVAWLICAAMLYVLLISQLSVSIGMFDGRYFVFSIPLFLFAVSVAIVELSRSHRLALMTVPLLVLTQVPAVRANQLKPKEPYREAVRWLESRVDKGGLVLTTWNKNYYRVYFEGSNKAPEFLNFTQATEVATVCRQVEPLSGFVVVAFNTHESLLKSLMAGCGSRYEITEQYFGPLIAQHWTR